VSEDEDREFERLWGPWDALSPADAASLFEGFPRHWWISGGWAIDAFTGRERPHKDVDVTIFRRDLTPLREHFRGRYDLWAAGSGMLRPLDDGRPRLPSWSGQVWVREHALASWILDILINPGSAGRWIFKRERTTIGTLDDATWISSDGLRYLRPELVLAHKARLARPADDDDLAAALPLLDGPARRWLADYVARESPTHPWRQLLASPEEERPGRLTAPRTLFADVEPSATPPRGQAP